MKPRYKILISLIAFLFITIGLIVTLNYFYDPTFNKIELQTTNEINNYTGVAYLDTVATVTLNQADINYIGLTIVPARNEALNNLMNRQNFEAFVTETDLHNHFTIYIKPQYSRSDYIKVLSHESIHIKQYLSGDLKVIDPSSVIYKGEQYDLRQVDYNQRPWEKDAYKKSNMLRHRVKDILW